MIKLSPSLLSVFLVLLVAGSVTGGENRVDLSWPQVTSECKPWVYWWWLGSGVDETNLVKELTRYRDAGAGGVHIIPIYGAKGWESRYIDYLSPKWMQMLGVTVAEAKKLGLGVDMTTGTGWCFGGPNVSSNEASAEVVVKNIVVAEGKSPGVKFDPGSVQALVAFPEKGKPVDLTGKILKNGSVDWIAEGGSWKVYSVSQRPNSKVKRAAPGGEGYMLNPCYIDAVTHYLERFSEAFRRYDGPKPRAMYHDSFEYGVNWSPDLFKQFERRRGYRLQDELPAFSGAGNDEHTARLKSDYRETVSDMMSENFVPVWTKWAHKFGFITRNQAHGSPGNLLDLYAAADIPETEMFHTDRRPLVAKFASSAAHVAGHNLTSAETGTWLKEHFTETLADVKGLVDDMFIAGINHVFYHGTCYSPDEAGWPGWLFYASTEMNPRNAIWRDVPALNGYIGRCQSVLQSGKSDNDILMYWPIYDCWHNASGMGQNLAIHGGKWFLGQQVGVTASNLWRRGFTFDYCSDRQLADTKAKKGVIRTAGGGEYKVVVVPACDHVPVETMESLVNIAKGGGSVIFQDHVPVDVPGLGNLEKRRAELKKLIAAITPGTVEANKIRVVKLGNGRIIVGELDAALAVAGVTREEIADCPGMLFIRRSFDSGHHYFISNSGTEPFDGWVKLARRAESVVIMDALRDTIGLGGIRKDAGGNVQVHLQLQQGESVVLRAFSTKRDDGMAWQYCVPAAGAAVAIQGTWQLKFVQGGPVLPKPVETVKLESWTTIGDDDAKRFAGTGCYTIHFDAPGSMAGRCMLDLGKVCESARVRLNGQELGTLIMPPFRVIVSSLKPKDNVLEVEVTNLSANRIRDLDVRGVQWRTFNDINFVNINYKPFDASKWPLSESGLLGPVTVMGIADSK